MSTNRQIIVFGREPKPGRVKTRLAAGIGEIAALRVYERLLEHTIRVIRAARVRAIFCCSETPEMDWKPAHDIDIEVQLGADLGSRMLCAFTRQFRSGVAQAVLIGSDCPDLQVRHLEEAFAALDRFPVVLGPARDGGYWLVGQRAPGFELFSGIPWSTSLTLAATRDKLTKAEVSWTELETLSDLDTVDDLEKCLQRGCPDPQLEDSLRQIVRQ